MYQIDPSGSMAGTGRGGGRDRGTGLEKICLSIIISLPLSILCSACLASSLALAAAIDNGITVPGRNFLFSFSSFCPHLLTCIAHALALYPLLGLVSLYLSPLTTPPFPFHLLTSYLYLLLLLLPYLCLMVCIVDCNGLDGTIGTGTGREAKQARTAWKQERDETMRR